MSTFNLTVMLKAVDRMTAPLRSVQGALKGLTGPLNRVMGGLKGVTAGAAKAAGALVGLSGISFGGLGFGVLSTAREFEKYGTVLTNLEGSSEAAKKAMGWVTEFAARTPYEVGEVMQAFIDLKGQGVDPTAGALRSLVDGAAGSGKSLTDLIQALGDVQQNQFDRLAELSIRAERQNVIFSYEKAGRL